jgi:putative membrane protein
MKRILWLAALLAVLVFAGECWGYDGSRMGGYSNMMFYGHGLLFLWMIVFFIICAVIYLFVQHSYLRSSGRHLKESALDILEKRYALGEITKDQFMLMKKDIEK